MRFGTFLFCVMRDLMRFGFGIVLFFSLLNCPFARLLAQDTRTVSEPVFPPTCAVYHAPLQSTADEPSVGSSVTEQEDRKSVV